MPDSIINCFRFISPNRTVSIKKYCNDIQLDIALKTINGSTIIGTGDLIVAPTSNVVVTNSSQSLVYGTDYFFTGTTTTFTLPAINSTIKGRHSSIYIKNRGSGNITVVSNTGGNDIYGTSSTNSLIILPGEFYEIVPDGIKLNLT